MTNVTCGNHGPANTLEQALREQLTVPGNSVKEALGWDSSSVSRFLSGQQGVPIHKIDALVKAADYVMVDRKLFKAMTTMTEIGVHCHCAKEAGGVPQKKP